MPVAAFAIGLRFPSTWWPAGPAVAVLAAVLAVLPLPSYTPLQETALGTTVPGDEVLFFVLSGGWVVLGSLAPAYSVLAWACLRAGQRRGAQRHRSPTREGHAVPEGGRKPP